MLTVETMATAVPWIVRGQTVAQFLGAHPDLEDMGPELLELWKGVGQDMRDFPSMAWSSPTEMPDTTGVITKFNPNHDTAGRFSSGAFSVSINAENFGRIGLAQPDRLAMYQKDLKDAADTAHSAIKATGAPLLHVEMVGEPWGPVGGKKNTVAWYSKDQPGKLFMNQRSEQGASAFFAAHEYAHILDAEHYGKGGFATGRANSELTPVVNAMRNSPEYKKWLYDFPNGSYWSSSHEMFARAFAQYAANKSGDTGMVRGLTGQGDAQWSPESFKPISAEFDKLFGAGS